MNTIDFKRLDGESAVATERSINGGKLALVTIVLVGIGVLAYVNWPAYEVDPKLTRNTDETFETASSRVSNFPEEQAKTASSDTIHIPLAQPSAQTDTAAVDLTVAQGLDLARQRELLEAQLRADEERRRQEEERAHAEAQALARASQVERLAAEEKAKWERLRSEQIILDGSTTGSTGMAGMAEGTVDVAVVGDGQLVAVSGADSDQNKAFLAASEQQTAGIVKAMKFARIDALVSQGTLIRGFLETAINTDLPGMVRAVIREDVLSLDGRRVLIPKGARLVGEYKSGLARGQKRVFIVWSRVIRSDGVSVDIASPGADRLGRAGMGGIVDGHFFERFGSAIMLTVIGGAAEFISVLGSDGLEGVTSQSVTDPVTGRTGVVSREPNHTVAEARSIAADRSSSVLQEIATEAFRDTANIPPTLYVPQGESIVVFVRRDLDFSALYADPVSQELSRIKRGGGRRHSVDPTPLYPDAPVHR